MLVILFSVTEDHPEVKAMVLGALDEAKKLCTSPLDLYAEALGNHVKQVLQRSTWQQHLHKLQKLIQIHLPFVLQHYYLRLLFKFEEFDLFASNYTGG